MTTQTFRGPRFWMTAGLGALVALGAAASTADAQSVEQFYKDNRLRIIVGSGAGGGYDTYTRSFARHFTRQTPGNPRIVVQNMPASSARAEAAPAVAQRRPMGLGNPSEQRETIIAQLRQLPTKVDALASKFNKPIEVKVVQMPAVKD